MRLERELEAELVVALPGAAVDDGLRAELEGDSATAWAMTGRESADTSGYFLVERVGHDRARALLVGERILAVDEQNVLGSAARARTIDSSTSSSWPTSTSTATTSSKPYGSSWSQARMQLVSSPPE